MALSMVRSRAGLTILPRSRGGFDGRYLFCFFPGKINPPMRRMHIATFDESRSGGVLLLLLVCGVPLQSLYSPFTVPFTVPLQSLYSPFEC